MWKSRIDDWITDVPEEHGYVCRCIYCDKALYEGDYLYVINGEDLCEDCARKGYAEVL